MIGHYLGGNFFGRFFGNASAPASAFVSIRKAVFASLVSDTSLTSIVGNNVYPGAIGESAQLPAILYQLVSDVPGRQLDGADGTSRARFQLTAVSRAPGDCDQIQRAIYDLFESFSGTLPGSVQVLETIVKSNSDFWVAPIDGTQTGTFRTPVDVIFTYRSPKPSR